MGLKQAQVMYSLLLTIVIKLRILAHFSADSGLCDAFHQGVDVFKSIAALWLSKLEADVTVAEGNQVKQICYALIYGAGVTLVAQQAQVSVESATKIMKDFLQRLPRCAKIPPSHQKAV